MIWKTLKWYFCMEQESISKTVAIIGAGPAGCTCAKFLQDYLEVSLFDKGKLLNTILPTGGGRCNLANAEYDFKELTKNYPRGEKFLYSVFSKFSTQDTIDFFKSIGVETYTQENGNRIFPVSNSSKEVREKLLDSLNCKKIKEEVIKIERKDGFYKVVTNKSSYAFDYVVISIGGHSNFDLLKDMGVNIIPPTQSLVGLRTKEDFSSLAGVSLKNIRVEIGNKHYQGDMLFTHKGISGPLIYRISSIYARTEFSSLKITFVDDFDLQDLLNSNPHKEIKNLIGRLVPHSLGEYLLNKINITPNTLCHKINAQSRNKIYKALTDFEITIEGKVPDSEVVTCGGVDLKEVNSQTMEHKVLKGLYFCGEVLDIDGFCGGFNLQNCWSGAYVASQSIIQTK